MKTQRFILLFAFLSVVLAACASPAKGAPIESNTPVLTWQRNGGIAGFCDTVTILASGAYTVENCSATPSTRKGQLDEEQLKQLTTWVNKFQSFEEGNDVATATYPDQMFVKTVFTGAGSASASVEDKGAISNFAAALTAPAQSGDEASEVASRARDFLATSLSIEKDAVKIVSVEAVDWPDACLGIVREGQMCAQVITPGYKIILEALGKSYELHVGEHHDGFLVAP